MDSRTTHTLWVPGFLTIIWIFLLCDAVFLSALRNGASFDGAEQLLYTQYLALGYGRSQPPLYTWLLTLSQQLFGVTLFAENILKLSLVGIAFTAIHHAAQVLWRARSPGRISVLLCLLVPEIVWEMQRNYSHSVLLMALSALMILTYLLLLKRPGAWRFAGFGLVLGLMLLAKYNAAFIIVSLAIADLWVMRKDGVFARPRILLAMAIAVIVIGPHLFWASQHLATVTALSGAFQMGPAKQMLQSWLSGISSLVLATLSLSGLVILFVGVALGRRAAAGLIRQASVTTKDPASVMLLTAIIFLVLSVLLVLSTNATEIRPRWLLPAVVPFVLWLGGEMYQKFSQVRPMLTRLAVLIAAIASIGLIVEEFRPGARTAFDYQRLSTDLHDRLQPDALLFTEYQTFANLRLSDPRLLLIDPVMPQLPDLTRVVHPVAVWVGDPGEGSEVLRFASRLGLSPAAGFGPVELTLTRRFGSTKQVVAQMLTRSETDIAHWRGPEPKVRWNRFQPK